MLLKILKMNNLYFKNKLIEVYCDDCLKIMDSMIKNGEKVDFIITDPPYGVGFKNNFYDDSNEYILKEMPKWFCCWFDLLKDDCFLFLFVGVKTIHNWILTGIENGFNYKNIIATRSFNNGSKRAKNNFGFQFQPIIIFSKGEGKKFNNVDFFETSYEWLNDKRNKNPNKYTYEYPNFIKTETSYATEKHSFKSTHPNEKNIQLIEFFIKISTNDNDLILDSFAGSGNTGISCINTNRRCILIEKEEKYCEIIKNRLKNNFIQNELF